MNLIESNCHKCGVMGESTLSYAGKHIKQSCGSCGAYIKFIQQNTIPDVREIRLQIWSAAKQDTKIIEEAKEMTGFVPDLIGVHAKLQWYKIYKYVKDTFSNR